ncbi:uncharacterized protein LOC114916181 [Cajanus cajan]|uniref:uncharacterized protein LOC114916181 n=1 Tax=Cajanus cajan TaxID=3821 RepID=UPI0010FB2574|nr:uncharacterized protein LOC114916181 [Cajanus cajan]
MGKSKWRELKARYNTEELEVPEPGEEEVAPLETRRKRKRGEKTVRETSAPCDFEEVTSRVADANPDDLTGTPPPEGSPRVVVEEVTRETQVGPTPREGAKL